MWRYRAFATTWLCRSRAMHALGSNISSFQLNRASGGQRNSIATGSKRTFKGSHPGALTLNRRRNCPTSKTCALDADSS